ncbi:hypothetical protein RchiOBHm_Chr2g0172321 [Rosa chinensis]|uniref:Uncharacterized protein n=1 Tax=Rosa chinensis TaxID=74649 RepID=A0A2P6S5J6_ROSCH|nr:hypothetical protein RchiOBHm_Chr2g0172321 [Rosa chinensis]
MDTMRLCINISLVVELQSLHMQSDHWFMSEIEPHIYISLYKCSQWDIIVV